MGRTSYQLRDLFLSPMCIESLDYDAGEGLLMLTLTCRRDMGRSQRELERRCLCPTRDQ